MDEFEFESRIVELVMNQLEAIAPALNSLGQGQAKLEEFDLSLRIGTRTVRVRGREEELRVDLD